LLKLLPPWNSKGLVSWTRYKKQAYGDFFRYTREKLGNDRVISARPADDFLDIGVPLQFTSRDVNFAGWVGDQDHSWEGLRAALDSLFLASLHNHVSSGSDIGGFRSGKTGEHDPPKDVFIRWAQLGAFCPVMENGGGGEHRSLMYDAATTAIYTKFALLHHALIPYIYSQAAYSYERRLPTMRPTAGKYQYLLGDDILVAPMVEAGDERTVVFPAGEWIYLFDESKIYRQGVEKLTFPLDEFPVFIRKGAIIPMQGAGEDFITVHIYPAEGSRQFGFYEENKPGVMLSYTKDGDTMRCGNTATKRTFTFRVH
jgi:alpha-D-xyloside xylohydrolase